MLMAALAGERGKLRRAVAGGHAALRDRLCAALSLPAGTSPEDLAAAFCAEGAGDESGLRAAAVALAAGSVTRSQARRDPRRLVRGPAAAAQMIEAYTEAYLTEKGEILQRLITRKAASAAACDACAVLMAEAERVEKFRRGTRRRCWSRRPAR